MMNGCVFHLDMRRSPGGSNSASSWLRKFFGSFVMSSRCEFFTDQLIRSSGKRRSVQSAPSTSNSFAPVAASTKFQIGMRSCFSNS